MRNKILASVAVGAVTLAIAGAISVQRFAYSGQPAQPLLEPAGNLMVEKVDVFERGLDTPNEIRITAAIDTRFLKRKDGESFRLNILMSPGLGKHFDLGHAVVWKDEHGKKVTLPDEFQPFKTQPTPKRFDGQLYFIGLPDGQYKVEFYLSPTAKSVSAGIGIAEFLSKPEDRKRNFQLSEAAD